MIGRGGPLFAVCLTDRLADGLSLVYSFYAPFHPRRSLGAFVILDHIEKARQLGLPHVYLGYWVEGSKKMGYKAAYLPQSGGRRGRDLRCRCMEQIGQEEAEHLPYAQQERARGACGLGERWGRRKLQEGRGAYIVVGGREGQVVLKFHG